MRTCRGHPPPPFTILSDCFVCRVIRWTWPFLEKTVERKGKEGWEQDAAEETEQIESGGLLKRAVIFNHKRQLDKKSSGGSITKGALRADESTGLVFTNAAL